MISHKIIEEFIKTAPTQPGIYQFLDKNGVIMYVGKAKSLKDRLKNYLSEEEKRPKILKALEKLKKIDIIETASEREALLLEASLIKNLRPFANILLKEGYRSWWAAITHDSPPRIAVKNKLLPNEKGAGPFIESGAAYKLNLEVQRLFQIRSCEDSVYKNRSRPCLLHQIKRCSAPCVNLISKEEYNDSVKSAKMFLQGNIKDIEKNLQAQMMIASEEERYEYAQILKERIKSLSAGREPTPLMQFNEIDAFALAKNDFGACIQAFIVRNGYVLSSSNIFFESSDESPEKIMEMFLAQNYADKLPPSVVLCEPLPNTEWRDLLNIKIEKTPKSGAKFNLMERLIKNAESALERKNKSQSDPALDMSVVSTFFKIPTISRVEVYDASHLSGTNTVVSMAVIGPNGFDKFRSKVLKDLPTGANDLASIKYALKKRLELNDPLPDLFLIDGGPTQLNAALEVLKDKAFVVSISKGPDRNSGNEELWGKDFHIIPDRNSDLIYTLQRWRDRAHTLAITTQRKSRTKRDDPLSSVQGLGPKKRADIRKNLGKNIMRATVEEFASIKGIGEKKAKEIWEKLRE